MSDENIKTWPENIYFQAQNDEEGLSQYKDACEYLESITWCEQPDSKLDVKYIRADIAAGREDKLVATAIEYSSRYGCPTMMVDGRAVVDDSVIYSATGLEKLK